MADRLEVDSASAARDAALRESEERLRLAIEATGDAVWDWDLVTNRTTFDDRYYSMLGFAPGDFPACYDSWRSLLHPDDRTRVERAITAAFADLQPGYSLEFRLRTKDGGWRWIASRGRVMSRDANGRPIRVVGTHVDISDRMQSVEASRENAERLRVITEGALDGILIADGNGRIIFANSAASRLYGYPHDELLGLYASQLVTDGEGVAKRLAKAVMELRATGTTSEMGRVRQLVARRKDGTELPVEIALSALSAGSDWQILAVVRDVSERQRARAALDEKTREIDRFFASTLDLLCIAETSGRLRRVNPEWERSLGYPPSELEGALLVDFVHPDDRQRTLDAVACLAAQVQAVDFVTRFHHKNGAYRWVEWRCRPAGDLIYASARDVTDRIHDNEEKARLEEQLRQAQRMEAIGRLAGGVAHDFNNILTSIGGNVELALLEVGPTHPLMAILHEIRAAAANAAALTKQLLAFSRKQIVDPKLVDVGDLISRLEKMLVRIIGEDVALQAKIEPGLPPVRIDPAQLEQVILNLVCNARDAMPEGGRLTIEAGSSELDEGFCARNPDARPGPHVVLLVSDTGQGMTEEVKRHLFEPFFTTKPMGKGTGLGLAMAYGVVRQAGGVINVESQEGRGATFRIFLPRTGDRPQPRTPAARRVQDMPRGHETVLLVEDEPSVRALVVRVLTRLGYRVLAAADAEAALTIARECREPLALLLTDVIMPGLNGRQLADRVRELHPEMKALFTSGYTEEIIGQHGVLEPGVSFLQKPYQPTTLAKKLREILG